jgi:hypothetical protein
MVPAVPKIDQTLPVVLEKSCGQKIDDVSTQKGLDRVLKFRHISTYLDKI